MQQIGIGANSLSQEVEQLLANQASFWLITAQEGEAATGIIPSRFKIIKQVNLAHGLHLRYYQAEAVSNK
jgi:hypothetical protein